MGVHLFHKLREWGFICNNEQQLIVANAKSYAINSYRTRPSICHINIGNLNANIKHNNCHNSGPRGSPMARIWHAP